MRKPSTRELFNYWNELRGTRSAPERRDIDPTRIRHALANTFILEAVDGDDAGGPKLARNCRPHDLDAPLCEVVTESRGHLLQSVLLGLIAARLLLHADQNVGVGTEGLNLDLANAEVVQLLAQLTPAVLTDLKLSAEGAKLDAVYPSTLPDLFQDDELRVSGRIEGTKPAKVVLGGERVRLRPRHRPCPRLVRP